VFNYVGTHQSRNFSEAAAEPFSRKLSEDLIRSESDIQLPPYHADTPEARRCWWRYHHLITAGDLWVAEKLRELDEAGVADNTIVFFTSDHGAGMPRGKTTLYDLGIHVPLIVRIPGKWRHLATVKGGETEERLVSFVDFGPTVLQMAGVTIPEHMQGRPFLGEQPAPPRKFIFAMRDRFGFYCQTVRAVRDTRFKYLRNYRPGEPLFPWNAYHDQMPVLKEMRRLAAAGQLNETAARILRQPRPPEELYDTLLDPHEMRNLVDSPDHQNVLKQMRIEHEKWMTETEDLGLVPEHEMFARARGGSPFDAFREGAYPLKLIRDAAIAADNGDATLPALHKLFKHEDSIVRWWAILGLVRLGDRSQTTVDVLTRATQDQSPDVRIAAARGLLRLRRRETSIATLADTLQIESKPVQLHALLVLQSAGPDAEPALPFVQPLTRSKDRFTRWVANEVVAKTKRMTDD
jgi:uncharacterized sulfatase